MIPPMRAFLATLMLASLALPASAQSAEYQEVIAEAVAENAAGRYPEALALFRRAHALNPNARTLRAMGAVSYEVRQYVDSVRWLEAALIDQRQPLTDDQRSEVQGVLERAYRFVGRYEVQVEHGNAAQLTVDGQAADTPLILAIGEHRIAARDGGREAAEIVRVVGGENEILRLALPAQEQDGGGNLVDPIVEPVDEGPSHALSSASFAVAGVGAVLFAVGGGLGLGQKSDLDDMMCEGTIDGCPDGDVNRLDRLGKLATSGLIIAGVGLTTGLIFRFVLEREPEVSASAGRNGASIQWRRRF